MRLDLADRIDRHVHDNQQTGTAEEQRNARLCDHVFRQDTDDRQAKAKDKPKSKAKGRRAGRKPKKVRPESDESESEY